LSFNKYIVDYQSCVNSDPDCLQECLYECQSSSGTSWNTYYETQAMYYVRTADCSFDDPYPSCNASCSSTPPVLACNTTLARDYCAQQLPPYNTTSDYAAACALAKSRWGQVLYCSYGLSEAAYGNCSQAACVDAACGHFGTNLAEVNAILTAEANLIAGNPAGVCVFDACADACVPVAPSSACTARAGLAGVVVAVLAAAGTVF